MVERYKPKTNGHAHGTNGRTPKSKPKFGTARNGKGQLVPIGPGRPPGSQNKIPSLLKELILEAASEVGSDGKGTGGLKGYLKSIAKDKKLRSTYAGLIARVLPLQVTGRGGGPIQVFSLDPARLAKLNVEELKVLQAVMGQMAGKDSTLIDLSTADYEATLK